MLNVLLWQMISRVAPKKSFRMSFTDDAVLMVKKGMHGATGNIYAGLHEFEDMAFLLHMLHKTDTFFDVGANVGSYTVLAGKVVGCSVHAFEPVPRTFAQLGENIQANQIEGQVQAHNVGVGREKGMLRFSTAHDTVNHVVTEGGIEVPVKNLDAFTEIVPLLMKMDVEGFELPALEGAAAMLSNPAQKAIILELNGSGQRYGFNDADIIALLAKNGYEPFAYDPFSRSLAPCEPSKHENTIFIKDLEFVKERLVSAEPFPLWGDKI